MITECAPPWIESTLGCLVFLHTEVKIEPAADHVFTMIMIMIVATIEPAATDVFFKVDTWAGAQAVCDNLGGFLVETRLVKYLDFFRTLFVFKEPHLSR